MHPHAHSLCVFVLRNKFVEFFIVFNVDKICCFGISLWHVEQGHAWRNFFFFYLIHVYNFRYDENGNTIGEVKETLAPIRLKWDLHPEVRVVVVFFCICF